MDWRSMDYSAFKASLAHAKPAAALTPALAALWWAGKNDWEAAHRIVMEQEDNDCAWVHAHLHRVEGDLDNARYWYRRAGRPEASSALEDEWNAIAQALLN
jgi:hypothetical protein